MEGVALIRLAKMAHINNAVWGKLPDAYKNFTSDWEDLTEYQKELYIAGVEIMIVRYRLELSPFRWFWRVYYKCVGGF